LLLNDYLNKETHRAQNTPGRKRIAYKHLRETDEFFEAPREWLDSLPHEIRELRNRNPNHRQRVRVTADSKTGKLLTAICKVRVADLEIYMPDHPFDARISVSLEIRFPLSKVGSLVKHTEDGVPQTRRKDRLSFKHQDLVSIDLTIIAATSSKDKAFELELELDTKTLVAQGEIVKSGRYNHYEALVGIFLNYVRVLNRASIKASAHAPAA
jgi:hypothetical protein